MKVVNAIIILSMIIILPLKYSAAIADTATEEDLAPFYKTIFGASISLLQSHQTDMGKMEGSFTGLYLSGIFHAKSFMFGYEMEHIFGNPLYDGKMYGYENDSLQKSDNNRTTNYDRITELRVLSGVDFFNKSRLLTPYIGFAFFRWRDEYSGDESYQKNSIYYYVPIGMEISFQLDNKWLCKVRVEYDLIVGGNAKTFLGDAYPDANDPENKIKFGEAFGLKLTSDFKAKISDDFAFVFQPYVSYWKVNETDSTTAKFGDQRFDFIESENEITQFGLRIGLEF